MSDLDKLLESARRAKERIDSILLGAKVTDSGEARISATLLLTIAEQFAGIIHLVEGKFSNHAPIFVRSMLDELADLRNLVDDPNYLDQLRFEDARYNVQMVDDFKADPDVKNDPTTLATLKAARKKYQSIHDTLNSRGFKSQTANTKFRRAKLSRLYVSFRVFSSYTHGQLTNLIVRHAGDNALRYHDESIPANTAHFLTVAAAILCQAAVLAPHFTDIPEPEMMKAVNDIDADWKAAC
jgi:hypothetical protein